MEPNSPFSQAAIHQLGEFKKPGVHTGFRMANGQILVNFSDTTKHSVLAEIARQLGAELISVSGTWTFTPDENQDFKVIRIPKGK